jgi:hypothetical protein
VLFGLDVSGADNALFNVGVYHGNDSHGPATNALKVYSVQEDARARQVDNQVPIHGLHGVRPSLGQNTGDDATFSVAQQWLHECFDQYEGCRSTSPHTALPIIRLLFLEGSACSLTVRLIDRVNGDHEDSVTPGHCWGDQSHVPRLLKATETGMRERIDPSNLSQTFMDTFSITIRLGYNISG